MKVEEEGSRASGAMLALSVESETETEVELENGVDEEEVDEEEEEEDAGETRPVGTLGCTGGVDAMVIAATEEEEAEERKCRG